MQQACHGLGFFRAQLFRRAEAGAEDPALQHHRISHAALDPVMEPWDSAALVPCLLEAGGCVSTMEGNTDEVVFGRSLLTSCSPRLHDSLIETLNG